MPAEVKPPKPVPVRVKVMLPPLPKSISVALCETAEALPIAIRFQLVTKLPEPLGSPTTLVMFAPFVTPKARLRIGILEGLET